MGERGGGAWVVAADGREGEEGEYTAVTENNRATFQIHFLSLLFYFILIVHSILNWDIIG